MTSVSPNAESQLLSENEYEVVRLLMDMPFDSSLVGFAFLCEEIQEVVNSNSFQVNLSKNIYSVIAQRHNISISQVDKSIRNLLYNASNYATNINEILFPTMIIKNAFVSTKTKSFITAVADFIKVSRRKLEYQRALKFAKI